MELMNRIITHKMPGKSLSIENKVTLNGECVSLVKKEQRGKKLKDVVIKEFNINKLREEYAQILIYKIKIEDLFEEWGVEI